MLDQSRLPGTVEFLDCRDYRMVAEAIRQMKVRGAPAIGVTAAMGVALGAQAVTATSYDEFTKAVTGICGELATTRPTAVNLFWAIERMKRKLAELRTKPLSEIKRALIEESQRILDEDIAMNRAMGKHGAALVQSGQTILTHCNAGALATAGYGTALGVIRAAGISLATYAQTRPALRMALAHFSAV